MAVPGPQIRVTDAKYLVLHQGLARFAAQRTPRVAQLSLLSGLGARKVCVGRRVRDPRIPYYPSLAIKKKIL